jgi:hypothetical protein
LPVVADGCDFPQNGSLSLSYLVCGVHCPHSNTPVEHNSDRTLVPKSAGEDPISKWGPMLRSQVTHLLEKSLFPSVLWNVTLFQYGGLAQWSGSTMSSSQEPQLHLQRVYFQMRPHSQILEFKKTYILEGGPHTDESKQMVTLWD